MCSLVRRANFDAPSFFFVLGKTAIGVALNKLFGFAHTQSDDITTKKTAAGFGKNVETLLKDKDVKVVYADR